MQQFGCTIHNYFFYSSQHINVRPDIGLSDQQLIEIATKDLNRLLKSKNITKPRQKIIKQERRTLKNR